MRTFSLASDVKTPDVTGLETAWLEVRSILCKLCKLDACKFGLELSSKTHVSILKNFRVEFYSRLELTIRKSHLTIFCLSVGLISG